MGLFTSTCFIADTQEYGCTESAYPGSSSFIPHYYSAFRAIILTLVITKVPKKSLVFYDPPSAGFNFMIVAAPLVFATQVCINSAVYLFHCFDFFFIHIEYEGELKTLDEIIQICNEYLDLSMEKFNMEETAEEAAGE